jgi:hypothetical protein
MREDIVADMKCLKSAAGVALSCGIVLASLASAQTKKPDTPITVCDLFKDLPAHEGEMISVTGFETVLAAASNQRAKPNAPGQKPEVRVTVIGRLRVKAHYEIVKGADGAPIGEGYGHLDT